MFSLIDLAWCLPQLMDTNLFVEIVRHDALVLLILISLKLHHVVLTYLFNLSDSTCKTRKKGIRTAKSNKGSRQRQR
jgi:hypothetical protein